MSKILFVMLHPGFVRYYDDALMALASGGHQVHVAFEVSRTKLGEDQTARRLSEVSPRLSCGTTPVRVESVREFLARGDRRATRSSSRGPETGEGDHAAEAWESLATTVRLLLDYLRFFEPAFEGAVSLRARAEKRLPRVYVSLVRLTSYGGAYARSACAAALRLVERAIPPPPPIDAFLREHKPDLLLVTPLVELGSQQVDYIKSARRLGLRSALCVASWDNLTSKGLIRVAPDHVVVWNEAQRREAETLHAVSADRVVVTGAQLFDKWFDGGPSRSREAFCREVGLDPERPFVLYVGSSSFIAPEEVPFVERWLARLRGARDRGVAALGVLVRPHPANARQWRAFDRTAHANVVLWPPVGTDPNAPDFRRDYFDSIHHCAAVMGINTSAQIEAAIIGRPVLTIRAPEFAHSQDGTLHFRYLVEDGGPVRVAQSMDEHLAQLREVVEGGSDGAGRQAFVRRFIRPHGLDVPSTPIFANAIGELARLQHPRPEPTPAWVIALRPLALVAARVAHLLAEDRPLWVYLARPFITAAVWVAAPIYRARSAWDASAKTGAKRARRWLWALWYESSREIALRLRRWRKPVARFARHVGGAVKRAGGRGL